MNKFLEWAKMLLNAAEAFREQQDKVDDLHEQVRHLTEMNKLFVAELKHSYQIGALEREKLKLEIMNELLRRLPPPVSPTLPPPPQP